MAEDAIVVVCSQWEEFGERFTWTHQSNKNQCLRENPLIFLTAVAVG